MSFDEIPALERQVDEFKRLGPEVIAWIAEYLRAPERYPVLSRVQPGEIRAQLPSEPPVAPEPLVDILGDFKNILMPGMTHWNHPGFMAYFANSSPAPGVVAEMLAAALNQNAMLWRTSPAATELEEVVIGWLAQMLGLSADETLARQEEGGVLLDRASDPAPSASLDRPNGERRTEGCFLGFITDTASISSLLAICAAREALPGLNLRAEGLGGRERVPRLRLYCSEQAHSSIERAAMTLGIGQAGVRKISTDADFRMDANALRQAIEEDLSSGGDPESGDREWRPCCVVATAGTTSTTAVDPLGEIAQICREYGLWLHVDAAYGGAVAIVPELRPLLAGLELADSIVVNPHKWLFTPMDCSVLFARDMQALRRAFSLVPDYLMTEGDVTNYMDYGVQLGRRFRALKLWMIFRSFGTRAMIAMIREHVRLAQKFAGWVDGSSDFERLAPAPMSVVCFRAAPAGVNDEASLEALNVGLIEAVNATGEIFLSHTRLNGRFTVRIAIGNMHTSERHVLRAWELLQSSLSKLIEKSA